MMRYAPELGRHVLLRVGTTDEQTLRDVTIGRYHLPPPWMPAPATVLDLGANIGLTAAHYERLWPLATITAIEMDASNVEVARDNWPVGMILSGAVVASYADRDEGYDQSMPAEAYALGTGTTRPLTVYKLADLCHAAAGLVPVDFVKMDVEGMEWRLLDTAAEWAPSVRRLLVELHGTDDLRERRERARGPLLAAGYTVQASTHPAGLFAWRP